LATNYSIEEVIYRQLITDSTLTAIFSTNIYIDEADQGQGLPYLCFFKIAGLRNVPDNFICYPDGGEDGFQFDIYVDNAEINNRLNARSTRETIITAVRNLEGTYNNYHIDWVQIQENDVRGIEEAAFRLTFTATIKWTKQSNT
jgi:hypothetical protein